MAERLVIRARNQSFALLVAAMLALGACSHSPKPADGTATPAPTPAPKSETVPPPAPRQFGEAGSVALDSVSIGLERTPCFGFCPVYSLTLFGTGEVVYRGERNVGVTGERRDTMSVDAFVELVDTFRRLRFEDAPDEYASRHGAERRGDRVTFTEYGVTDLPTTILTLKLGAKTKTTRLYVDYPTELRALADSIDSKSGALRWIAGGRPGAKGEDR